MVLQVTLKATISSCRLDGNNNRYIVSSPLRISDRAVSNAFACLAEGYVPYNLLSLVCVWIVQP